MKDVNTKGRLEEKNTIETVHNWVKKNKYENQEKNINENTKNILRQGG